MGYRRTVVRIACRSRQVGKLQSTAGSATDFGNYFGNPRYTRIGYRMVPEPAPMGKRTRTRLSQQPIKLISKPCFYLVMVSPPTKSKLVSRSFRSRDFHAKLRFVGRLVAVVTVVVLGLYGKRHGFSARMSKSLETLQSQSCQPPLES